MKDKKTETEKDLKQKQFDVIQSVQTLSKSSEKFARVAEEKQDFTLLTKYNIFRSSAKEKKHGYLNKHPKSAQRQENCPLKLMNFFLLVVEHDMSSAILFFAS